MHYKNVTKSTKSFGPYTNNFFPQTVSFELAEQSFSPPQASILNRKLFRPNAILYKVWHITATLTAPFRKTEIMPLVGNSGHT